MRAVAALLVGVLALALIAPPAAGQASDDEWLATTRGDAVDYDDDDTMPESNGVAQGSAQQRSLERKEDHLQRRLQSVKMTRLRFLIASLRNKRHIPQLKRVQRMESSVLRQLNDVRRKLGKGAATPGEDVHDPKAMLNELTKAYKALLRKRRSTRDASTRRELIAALRENVKERRAYIKAARSRARAAKTASRARAAKTASRARAAKTASRARAAKTARRPPAKTARRARAEAAARKRQKTPHTVEQRKAKYALNRLRKQEALYEARLRSIQRKIRIIERSARD